MARILTVDDQRRAEEGADDDQHRENQYVGHGRRERDRPDDVGSDEELQPRLQDLAGAHLVPRLGVGRLLARVEHVGERAVRGGDDDNRDRQGLIPLAPISMAL
jgi:hypothetical protein